MAKKKLSTESVWLVLEGGKVIAGTYGRAKARERARVLRECGRKVTVKSGEIQTFVYTESKG